jgi:hypothetical protein
LSNEKEIENSLERLTMLANKIKISDFNPRDKMNILDVFVNNEKVLMSIFEIVF